MNEPKQQLAMLPEPANMTPMQMLQIAVSKGVDAEQIKALMQLEREWKADRAREAYTKAMNDFRAEAISITRTKSVSFKDVRYKHALLSNILEIVVPYLTMHGLSHRWETKQEGQAITVACVITHELGHSGPPSSLTASPDTSGSKNSVQAIGSTVSYLQRYTFLACTGLTTKDADNDGAGGEKPATIDEKQVADLHALMEEVGVVGERRERALNAWQVDSLDQVLQKNYAAVVKSVEAKRK